MWLMPYATIYCNTALIVSFRNYCICNTFRYQVKAVLAIQYNLTYPPYVKCGSMRACHAAGPGSIPGRDNFSG